MYVDRKVIEEKYKNVVGVAKEHMSKTGDIKHDMSHIQDVVENTVEIIRKIT